MGLYTVFFTAQYQKSPYRIRSAPTQPLFVAICRQTIIKTVVFIAATDRLGNNAYAVLSNKGTFQNEKYRSQS
jgi:hypothetical protein